MGQNFYQRYKVAFIVETANIYGQGLMVGVSQYIKEHGPWIVHYEERSLDSSPPRWLSKWDGDGIIIRDRSGESCKLALQTEAAVVDLSENRQPGIPTVISDHRMTSELAAKHLLDIGFTNFAFVSLRQRPFSNVRKEAFREFIKQDCPVYELRDINGTIFSDSKERKQFGNWLKSLTKPVGIMACYDLVGLFVLQVCQETGISVPDEAAVVGVNNDPLQCTLSTPPMTSVVQDTQSIGYEACALLHKLMQGEPVLQKRKMIPALGVVPRRSTDIFLVPDPIVVKAIHVIRENVIEGMTVQAVASHLGIARRTLERRFIKHLGKTPYDEIADAQIRIACDLLQNTKLTTQAIARRIGFSQASNFSAFFKKRTGKSPFSYRNKKQNDSR